MNLIGAQTSKNQSQLGLGTSNRVEEPGIRQTSQEQSINKDCKNYFYTTI